MREIWTKLTLTRWSADWRGATELYEQADNLTEALMFLSHYIGDVHQPLHVGFTGDEGGNTITVRWYRRQTNLHHVWDNMIIESALKKYYNKSLPLMIQALQTKLTKGWSNDVPSWESCQLNQTACPNPYASESINLACKYAYRNATPGTTLGDDYFLSRLPIVEKRLAQGGIRLAATLNVFSFRKRTTTTSHNVLEQVSEESEAKEQQKDESKTAKPVFGSSMLFNQDSSLGFSAIKWGDSSRGPFDLGFSSSRKFSSGGGDSISFGALVKDFQETTETLEEENTTKLQ